MRILFHTGQVPYPADTGGKIRSSKLLEELARRHEVSVVCFRREADAPEDLDRLRAIAARVETVPWADPPRGSPRYLFQLARNMVSSLPFSVARHYAPAMERAIRRLVAEVEPQVLVCDFLHTTRNMMNVAFFPKILSQHNVEAVIARRRFEQETNPLARALYHLQWLKLRQYEEAASKSFHHSIMVSDQDRETLASEYGVTTTSTIPNGVDVDYFHPMETPAEGTDLVFTGSMDWLPNEDGISYFVKEILPLVRQQEPAVKVWVVGRQPTAALKRLAEATPGVELTGTVPDIRPYVARGQVYVVPLRIGGGTRIKILEAMAMGKAIVSTRIGAEGLDVTDDEDILLADEPAFFARRVVELLRDPERRRRLGVAGRAKVVDVYTWRAAVARFDAIHAELVRRG
ncbi:MAG: glycosyltransferase [Deltaproteobacteria bacterium]|nr:glycosyltransferase [Deltaproteobacteria bacterium]